MFLLVVFETCILAIASNPSGECISQKSPATCSSQTGCILAAEAVGHPDHGVVLLSKGSALSKATFKSERSKHERTDKELHKQAHHLDAKSESWTNLTGLQLHQAVTLLLKRSSGLFALLLAFLFLIVVASLFWCYRQEKQKHEIYGEDEDGWKNEVWVRAGRRGAASSESSPLPTADFVPGSAQRLGVQSAQSMVSQGRWAGQPESQASLAASSQMASQQRLSQNLLGSAGHVAAAAKKKAAAELAQLDQEVLALDDEFQQGEARIQRELEAEKQKVALAAKGAHRVMDIGRDKLHQVRSAGEVAQARIVKKVHHVAKRTGIEDTAESAGARVKQRWEEARAANV